jgi:hypothetical protein
MSGFNNRPPIGQQLLDNITSNVSGIFSTRPTAQFASGARTILKINGKIVGFAFNVSWRINTTATELFTIDDYLPAEIVPQHVTVDGSLSALHVPGVSATTEFWQPDVLSFLFNKYISIEVRDSQTDTLLFYTGQAMIVSRQEDIRAEQLASVTLTFKAIGWRDERDPSTPSMVNSPRDEVKNLKTNVGDELSKLKGDFRNFR